MQIDDLGLLRQMGAVKVLERAGANSWRPDLRWHDRDIPVLHEHVAD